MPEPYLLQLKLPDGQAITSVVMDEADYLALCDDIAKLPFSAQKLTAEDIAGLKTNKHIPMMARGTITEPLFNKLNVTTNLMCVIVRGHGPELLTKLDEKHANTRRSNGGR